MDIYYENENKELKEVTPGECFLFSDTEHYMRCEKVDSLHIDKIPCVNLKTGKINFFEPEMPVYELIAEVRCFRYRG